MKSIEQVYESKNYEKAIDKLDAYLFFNVTDIKALHYRARSYEELGFIEEAKNDYKRIIALNSDYAQAYAGLGKILFDQKKYEDAELRLLRAASLDSEDFEILYLLGRCQLMTGKYANAEHFLRLAKELNPEFGKLNFYLGMVLAFRGDVLGTAAAFNTYLKYEPDNIAGRYNRGFALMKAGYHEWALEDFDAVLIDNPNHLEAMAKKGYCLNQLGNPEGCALIKKAANKGSDYAQALEETCS